MNKLPSHDCIVTAHEHSGYVIAIHKTTTSSVIDIAIFRQAFRCHFVYPTLHIIKSPRPLHAALDHECSLITDTHTEILDCHWSNGSDVRVSADGRTERRTVPNVLSPLLRSQ